MGWVIQQPPLFLLPLCAGVGLGKYFGGHPKLSTETSPWPWISPLAAGLMFSPAACPDHAPLCATRARGTHPGDKGSFQGPGRAWAASGMCEIRLWPSSFLERNCSQRNRPHRRPNGFSLCARINEREAQPNRGEAMQVIA